MLEVKVLVIIMLECGTDHSGEVAGRQQASSVEGEENNGHGGQDEVVEGDVHRSLAAPVR